ncbi:MAG: hypothetical protein P8Q36_13310 [Alphaproteobacteria bacterium]|jgi:hypothetical protein|nr:hypothetical protein [Rhodospirillaceae bacterium]MDG2481827.1 hypothetical protein [Alphaproteobacteria bacterium]MBT6205252.1 hypothetical protein [Rhodospirillaceae bacterium]MBT6509166.1 hypothetical protein [Rhodospirillaceae bacterium]MBT7611865.1 hypothetical protein [Rhodospirillaceae bacterium]
MAFEDLEAELGILLGRLNNKSEDREEIYERLRETLNEMRAFGMPIPEDLTILEKELLDSLFGPAAENT